MPTVAVVGFGAVHGRRAACRQPPAPTSSSASVSVAEVDAPPRRCHLWRRSWAPGCMPAASRADVIVGFGKCRGSGRASAPSSSAVSLGVIRSYEDNVKLLAGGHAAVIFGQCRGSGRASAPSSSAWASSAAMKTMSSCSPVAMPPSSSASVVELSDTPAAPGPPSWAPSAEHAGSRHRRL
jgi:hypothetical protein